jgi:effector-binding domain-containing protein
MGGLFEEERGEAVLFVPIPTADPLPTIGPVHFRVIPRTELAIAMHLGPREDSDRTYGALGTYVTQYALSTDEPVREYYPVSELDTPAASNWETEIGWPIFQTVAR